MESIKTKTRYQWNKKSNNEKSMKLKASTLQRSVELIKLQPECSMKSKCHYEYQEWERTHHFKSWRHSKNNKEMSW
jgi:hypothetical protein